MTPSLSIRGQITEHVYKLAYWGSWITSGELSFGIQKEWLAFSKLHHLWRRNDMKLSTKGREYSAIVYSVLLCNSETWPLKGEDIRRLSVFNRRCLRNINKVCWEHKINNTEVRQRVLGPRNMSVTKQLYIHRLRLLGHVLRMLDDRLLMRALCAKPSNSWKRSPVGQKITWQNYIKSVIEGSSCVGNVRLAGWRSLFRNIK